ncbi:MAG: hypothetical protein R6U58_01840 [Bacteroidales bacterium]
MQKNHKVSLLWALAVVITVSSAIYQRSTGPTKPAAFNLELGKESCRFTLPRTHVITEDLVITLENVPESLEGKMVYRRYPTGEEWRERNFVRQGNDLNVNLPLQPPAGKLEYYPVLSYKGRTIEPAGGEPVVIRFRGDVPALLMIPHILFMFMAMLFSNLTGIMVLFRHPGYRIYMKLTFWTLLVGGLVLGPLIQDFAFGELWSGWPVGRDMTDNKTLVAFLVWAIACFANRKTAGPRPGFALLASVVLLIVYFIPHSIMGSELDYSTGRVVTGFIYSVCIVPFR